VVPNHLGNIRHGTLTAEFVQPHIPQHRGDRKRA
jgi:hypothetical protein